MHDNMTPEDLAAARLAPGLISGQPITAGPLDPVPLPLPPLHRPAVEVLVETLHLHSQAGGAVEEVYRASLAGLQVMVGRAQITLRSLSAVADTKDEAVQKLCDMTGQAVAQAYVRGLTSEDQDEVEAARSMEVGRDG